MPLESTAGPLQGQEGYRFFEDSSEIPFFRPGRGALDQYWDVVGKIAEDVAGIIKGRLRDVEPAAEPDSESAVEAGSKAESERSKQPSFTVYLAPATTDLMDEARRLRGELEAAGARVLPAQGASLPTSADALHATVEAALTDTEFSVHLLGAALGFTPDGSEKPMVELQLEVAAAAGKRREVIEKPIERAGTTIEPALVQRLLNDAGDTPDMLPVLQHALMRTWESACSRWFDDRARSVGLEDYVRVGGVEGALARHADEVVAGLGAGSAWIEPIVKARVDTDYEGRVIRRTPAPRLSDLVELCAAVDALRDDGCCFVRPIRSEAESLRDDTTIDVSHEAPIRRWERVERWREEEHRDGRIWVGLIDAVETGVPFLPGAVAVERLGWWAQRGPSARWAARYGARFDEVALLLEASRRQLRWERGSGAPWVAVVLLVLSVVGVGFGLLQGELRADADRLRQLAAMRLEKPEQAVADQARTERTADRAQASALTARAEEQTAQGQPVVGLRLATALLSGTSGFPQDMPEAQHAAYAALAKLARLDWLWGPWVADSSQIAFSHDGATLASGFPDNSVRVWDVASGETLATFEGHRNALTSVAFSPDGATLASGSADDIVRVRSLVRLPPVRVLAADAALEEPWLERLRAMTPERSGKGKAAYDQPPWARTGDTPLTAEVKQTRGGERVQIVVRSTGATVAEVPIAMDAGAVLDVAFSSDGRRSLTTTSRGRMAMWEILDDGEGKEQPLIGSPIARFGAPEDVFVAAAFDPDGTRVAGLLRDGRIKVWPVFVSRKDLVEFVDRTFRRVRGPKKAFFGTNSPLMAGHFQRMRAF